MHALDHAIGFEQEQLLLLRRGHHRAVVARAGDDVRTRFQSGDQLRDQPVLAQFAAANPSWRTATFIAGGDWGKRAR